MISTPEPTPKENLKQYEEIENAIAEFSKELESYNLSEETIKNIRKTTVDRQANIDNLKTIVSEMQEKEFFSRWWPTTELSNKQSDLENEEKLQAATLILLQPHEENLASSKINLDDCFNKIMLCCDIEKSNWLLQEKNLEKLKTIFEKNIEPPVDYKSQLDGLINLAQKKIEAEKIAAAEAAKKQAEAEAAAAIKEAEAAATKQAEEQAKQKEIYNQRAQRAEGLKDIININIEEKYNEKWDPKQSLRSRIKNHAFFQHKDRKSEKNTLKILIESSSSEIQILLDNNYDGATFNKELAKIYEKLSILLGSSNSAHPDFVSPQLSRNSQLGKVIKGIRKNLIQHRANYLEKSNIINNIMEASVEGYYEKKEILLELAKILNTDTISDYTEENTHKKNIFEKMLGFKLFTDGKRSEQLTALNKAKEEALLKIIDLLNGHGNPSNFEKDLKNIFNKLINTNKNLLDNIWEPHEKSRLAVLVTGLQAKIQEQNEKYFRKIHQVDVSLTKNLPAKDNPGINSSDNLKEDVEPVNTIANSGNKFFERLLTPNNPNNLKKR